MIRIQEAKVRSYCRIIKLINQKSLPPKWGFPLNVQIQAEGIGSGVLAIKTVFFHITFGFFVCTQDAAQQELNEQKQQYEEKVTHLHEAMVLEAFVHVELISVCHSGVWINKFSERSIYQLFSYWNRSINILSPGPSYNKIICPLTLKSVDEILLCYHSNETSSAVLSHGTVYLVCSSNFWVCGWNPRVLPFKWNLFSGTFLCYHLFSMFF